MRLWSQSRGGRNKNLRGLLAIRVSWIREILAQGETLPQTGGGELLRMTSSSNLRPAHEHSLLNLNINSLGCIWLMCSAPGLTGAWGWPVRGSLMRLTVGASSWVFSHGLSSARCRDQASLQEGLEQVPQEREEKIQSSSGLPAWKSLFVLPHLIGQSNCSVHPRCVGRVIGSPALREESCQRWGPMALYFFHLPLCSTCISNSSVFLDRNTQRSFFSVVYTLFPQGEERH